MFTAWLGVAFAAEVSLHVAVHRDAGTLADLAVDGAAGQCVALGMSRLTCPATGPVTFRWGPGGDWALTGETTLAPGEVGEAFVLAAAASRTDARARLASEVGPEQVRELFVGTSARPIPPPSRELFADLLGLLDHPDPLVRREAVRGLLPWVRHTASDPFPSDAPSLVPAGTLVRLAQDPDRRVRARAAALIREIGPEDPRAAEARAVTAVLARDPVPQVRRLAFAASLTNAREGVSDPLDAWRSALTRVPEPGPVGRAACNGLASLRGRVEAEAVDVDGAIDLVLTHHPDRAWRVWAAWREAAPFDARRAATLFAQTAGLSEALIVAWAAQDPAGLAEVVRGWEPGVPHSERFRVVGAWLEPRTEHADLRAALDLSPVDSLSKPTGRPGGG